MTETINRDKICGYHDETQRLLTELSTSSRWLVRLIGASIALGFPLLATLAVSFLVYASKLETRVTTLERVDQEVWKTIGQIKNQRNMDHASSGFRLQ